MRGRISRLSALICSALLRLPTRYLFVVVENRIDGLGRGCGSHLSFLDWIAIIGNLAGPFLGEFASFIGRDGAVQTER